MTSQGGTMWYNICHILGNILELYAMALPTAMVTNVAFCLPNILHVQFNIPEQNRTHNSSAFYTVVIL